MPWLTIAWKFRYLIGGIALAAVVWWQVTAYGDRERKAGEAAGRSAVEVLWQADLAAAQQAAEKAVAENKAKEEAARTTNEQIITDYINRISASAGERDRIAGLLNRARGEARNCAATEAANTSAAFAASQAQRNEYLRQLDSAIAGLRAEAGNNADQLDALIAVVKPQL